MNAYTLGSEPIAGGTCCPPCHLTYAVLLSAWDVELQAGKLKKSTKSEAEPVKNDGPVTILTANNFDDYVTLGKNVMIEFYAPWYALSHSPASFGGLAGCITEWLYTQYCKYSTVLIVTIRRCILTAIFTVSNVCTACR